MVMWGDARSTISISIWRMTDELDLVIQHHLVNTKGWRSLRPLQRDAIAPIRAGDDCVLVAPTAGGKTEASLLPLLTQMSAEGWTGTSVLYVAPLRALLNNLLPRVREYTEWVGRVAAIWHGDTDAGARSRILASPPDVLLTTPESIEAMLVSRHVDHSDFFSSVRAVVVDELHAFAAADRGWHLLGVLARLQRISGRRIQRVGLSATVGNPRQILDWLQDSDSSPPATVIEEKPLPHAAPPEVGVDYVGSVSNAAVVLAQMYRGEKRLVFCVRRSDAEELAYELRERGVTTFVSHSSMSKDERRISEQAFAEARDCVIVATSTLELGIDIGDLDRVIQLGAPWTVSSFLQRMGRTGRRPGAVRNMTFLATNGEELLRAVAVLALWERGFVEDAAPPPNPRHLTAQQLLAAALQEGEIWQHGWREWWDGSGVMVDPESILRHLHDEAFLVADGERFFIGPRAEGEFGRRHFMELLVSFVADPELIVVNDRRQIGGVQPIVLRPSVVNGVEPMLLAGRSWEVVHVDWGRFRVEVQPWRGKGRAQWQGSAVPLSFEMTRAIRDVLLGARPAVMYSRRATAKLEALAADHAYQVAEGALVRTSGSKRGYDTIWTWAGQGANATLIAALGAPEEARFDNESVLIPSGRDLSALTAADIETALPFIPEQAVTALKFNEALPASLARATLAERFADRKGADIVRAERVESRDALR